MDRIDLRVDLACIVGILPRERIEPQPLAIDIGMEIDLDDCGWTGRLETSVDYGAVDAQVRFLATHGGFRLIESMSVALLRLLLADPPPKATHAPLVRATVRIAKPTVLRSAVPSVTLQRDAEWATRPGDEEVDGCAHRVLVDLEEITARRVLVPAGHSFDEVGHALLLRTSEAVPLPFTPSQDDALLWVQPRPWSPDP
ncbi:MAG: dihydroneopterin aldolase [Myxococcota bacterium]